MKRIVCGKHGSLFDHATGACIEGKCAGQGLESVAVGVLDGDVCVTVLSSPRKTKIPQLNNGVVVFTVASFT